MSRVTVPSALSPMPLVMSCASLCDHTFHKPCLDNWLKINGTCPLLQRAHAKGEKKLTPRSPNAIVPLDEERNLPAEESIKATSVRRTALAYNRRDNGVVSSSLNNSLCCIGIWQMTGFETCNINLMLKI